MAEEIERKFLVSFARIPRESLGVGQTMVQGYLARRPTVRVRLAVEAGKESAWLTIKGPGTLARAEYEYAIPPEDARAMMGLCGAIITKVRYHVRVAEHVWDVDVYDGRYEGLVVGEVELGAVDEPFVQPVWAYEEVTLDPRYSNAALALADSVKVKDGRLAG